MMQDLHLVLDWDPEFAAARSMLAMAQLDGGGVHAAIGFDAAGASTQPAKPKLSVGHGTNLSCG